MFTPRRTNVQEFLDHPSQHQHDLGELLHEIRRANTRYGGVSLVLDYLAQFISLIPRRPLTLLDVATGDADIPRAVVDWARRKQVAIDVTAIDLSDDILALAARNVAHYPEIRLMRADALHLPFADRSFDLVINGLTLHHFTRADAVASLREIARVAREGFVVNDLVRSWIAYAGAWMDAHLFGRGRLVRHDAPLSVLRAFTLNELCEIVLSAGLRDVEMRRRSFFRAALVRRPGKGPA